MEEQEERYYHSLFHTAAHGLSDWYLRKGPVSADTSISKALEGRPVSIVDATEDDRIQYRKQAKQEGIASILSVPILLREEVVGMMRVCTAESREFTNLVLPTFLHIYWRGTGHLPS